ncbi:hypothetical protein P153DRAFT_53200 [Dothidotthia symphoricarpi CBS 119687]|uniref:Uncharacterized protein n=1 Tax=Dothidotthia symphoricarpi CBS 119687 TaxID=1392245 RepID=A0A6A6A903_9PLEO|nr:uncharacterized protein P153DRAFT_53200 [Dothidotthia symphoricarpi CBS 119687]KAF2127665.1 hypothetical protein P153DRAFT_53200 [Dothidotthia symphoricarpi CBS 119687]
MPPASCTPRSDMVIVQRPRQLKPTILLPYCVTLSNIVDLFQFLPTSSPASLIAVRLRFRGLRPVLSFDICFCFWPATSTLVLLFFSQI